MLLLIHHWRALVNGQSLQLASSYAEPIELHVRSQGPVHVVDEPSLAFTPSTSTPHNAWQDKTHREVRRSDSQVLA